jgi:cysteine-rich repeat protein
MSRSAWFGASLLVNLATLATAVGVECDRPTIEQLTHSSGPFLAANDHPSPSSDGRFVAFTNDTFGPALVQRLDTQTGMADNLSGKGNLAVSMSDSGARVVYDATFGTIGALDLIATFLYDYGAPMAERPRRIAGGEQASLAIAPAISGDGTKLAFFDFFTTDLGGGFGHFIQMLDTSINMAPLVTQPYAARMAEALTPFASRYLSFNRDGSRLAFATPSDLTGSNGDGNFEIFVYEHPGNVLLQTTRSSGGDIPLASGDKYPANSDASVNADGTRIAFLSNRDYTGANADGGFEVFLYDHEDERYFQITNTTGGDFISGPPEARTSVQPAILAPAIDGSGNRIAFMSNYDFFGTNPDRNWEIYLWDATGSSPVALQVTFSTINPNGRFGAQTNLHPALTADGTQVFFASSGNLTGDNVAGHDEIFRATLCPAAGVCGDGTVDEGEQCDDGANNDDEEPNACRTDCTRARCGDGVVDDGPPNNENCDDGNQIEGDDCPASCKFPIVLNPQLILGKGLCGDTPQDLEVLDADGNDITFDENVDFEYIEGLVGPAVLNAALSRVKNFLKDRFKIETPDLKTATIEIRDGQVHFAQGMAGLGFNMVQAKRTIGNVTEYSNRALVISGFRLITLDSLEIEPASLGTTVAQTAADLITRATGKELPNPPMILFSEGPCNDAASPIGRTGSVVVKSIKLAFLQGLISDVDLMAGVEQGIGLLPGKHPLLKLAKAIGTRAAPFVASQFLDFEVSSEASGASEKKDGAPPITMDAVIEVSDSFSRTAPFFKGLVSSRTPGISAVQATLDLGKCLGKATDDMMVFVGPRLEQQQIRNEQGRIEDPLRLGVNQERPATVVGLVNFLRDGEEPHEISFDILDILPDRVSDIKKFIEKWIPGGKKFVEGINVPIDLVVPSGAEIGDSGLYEAGTNYFRFKFTYNPFVPSITINESQLQTTIPNLPFVTTWSVPVPPNPPQPVASVDPTAGVLTGVKRGNGQLKVDVCLPLLTNQFNSDTNGIVVEGDDMLVAGIKFDDRNGNGLLDPTEPGVPGFTIEVLSGIGNVIGSDVTGADGSYTVRVTPEQLPVGLNSFGVREQQQSGWTATGPASGRFEGIPIALGARVGRDFGNFKDVTVQGVKFDDANSNGVRDGGEPGLGGWQIELTDSRGTVHRATTGGDGSYSFRLPFAALNGTGAMSIREVQQAGWHATFPAGGALELFPAGTKPESGVELNISFGNQLDAEASTPTITTTPTVTATPTPTDDENEDGTPTPTEESDGGIIAGHKFEDLNGNGERDNNEPGIGGWIIFLDDGNDTLDNPTSGDGVCDTFALEPCVVTTASGEYGFPADEEGTYDVREVQRPGWRQTTANPPTAVVTEVGQSFGDLDFGNQRTSTEATGDCNGDLAVAINELILGVNIALGLQPVDACGAFDRNVNGQVTIDELLRAVNNALSGVPTPLPTATVPATAPPTHTPPFTVTPSASPTPPVALTPTATRTALATGTSTIAPTATATPTITRTPTPSPTAPSTPSATRTRTATPTATEGPQSPPIITDINCDGFTACLLALDEPFSIEFSFEDADGDAASWEMIAERDDGVIFEIDGGPFPMPFEFGTTTVPFNTGFTCASGNCVATDWLFTVVVTDLLGNQSEPASIAISVLGSGE